MERDGAGGGVPMRLKFLSLVIEVKDLGVALELPGYVMTVHIVDGAHW